MCVWNSTCIHYVEKVEEFLVRLATFIHVLVYLTLERQTGTSISNIGEREGERERERERERKRERERERKDRLLVHVHLRMCVCKDVYVCLL